MDLMSGASREESLIPFKQRSSYSAFLSYRLVLGAVLAKTNVFPSSTSV